LPHHRIDQRRRASFHRGDGGGDCEVRWIVETAGSDGINYAMHSLCTNASLPEKTQKRKHHRAAAWPRSRGDGTIVRRFKELSALSITSADEGADRHERRAAPAAWRAFGEKQTSL